eukprot:gnl/TRDRNA2_/TRDRNA2_171332_c4_seq9.p1 gnl/TRDRNA2_/TRDRNA2_171332_c4~~gnl/TRDRNA2_/TRDRNA2_171332_c4_seq9.p1  ORF type:complete len:616 (-),score=223.52 gnl/TRDRNA2_/TRDRNA2_171332_c4_seq9:86-1897(-)
MVADATMAEAVVPADAAMASAECLSAPDEDSSIAEGVSVSRKRPHSPSPAGADGFAADKRLRAQHEAVVDALAAEEEEEGAEEAAVVAVAAKGELEEASADDDVVAEAEQEKDKEEEAPEAAESVAEEDEEEEAGTAEVVAEAVEDLEEEATAAELADAEEELEKEARAREVDAEEELEEEAMAREVVAEAVEELEEEATAAEVAAEPVEELEEEARAWEVGTGGEEELEEETMARAVAAEAVEEEEEAKAGEVGAEVLDESEVEVTAGEVAAEAEELEEEATAKAAAAVAEEELEEEATAGDVAEEEARAAAEEAGEADVQREDGTDEPVISAQALLASVAAQAAQVAKVARIASLGAAHVDDSELATAMAAQLSQADAVHSRSAEEYAVKHSMPSVEAEAVSRDALKQEMRCQRGMPGGAPGRCCGGIADGLWRDDAVTDTGFIYCGNCWDEFEFHAAMPEATKSTAVLSSAKGMSATRCQRWPPSACRGKMKDFLWRDEEGGGIFCDACWLDFERQGVVLAEGEEVPPPMVQPPPQKRSKLTTAHGDDPAAHPHREAVGRAEAAEQLPPEKRGWTKVKSRSTGAFYWFHAKTGKSQFETP